jgi:hypothetical protein
MKKEKLQECHIKFIRTISFFVTTIPLSVVNSLEIMRQIWLSNNLLKTNILK